MAELTKDERRELASKQQKEARSWLLEVGGDAAKSLETEGRLVKQLKGGVVLCTVLNALKPGSVKADSKGSLANVQEFLRVCKDVYDVPEAYLFDAEAFEAGKGSGRVVATILALRDKSKAMVDLDDDESSSSDGLVLYSGLKVEGKPKAEAKMSLDVKMSAGGNDEDEATEQSSDEDKSDDASSASSTSSSSSSDDAEEESSEQPIEAPVSDEDDEEETETDEVEVKTNGTKANGGAHVVLSKTSTSGELQLWLYQNNFQDYAETFSNYTGAAFMRLVGDRERLERIVSPQHSFLMELLLEENNANDFIEMKQIQQNSFRLSTLGIPQNVKKEKKSTGKNLISVGSSEDDEEDEEDSEQFEPPKKQAKEKKEKKEKMIKVEAKVSPKPSPKVKKSSSTKSEKKSSKGKDQSKEPKVALDEKPKKKKPHLTSHEVDYFTGKPIEPGTPGVIITGRYACLKQNYKCLNCKSKSFADPKVQHHSMPDGDGLYCRECIDKLWPARPPQPKPEFEYQQQGSYKAIRKREKIEYKIEKLQAKHEELMKPKEKKPKKGILGLGKKKKDKA